MLARRLIACMDTLSGRTVKGVRFEDLEETGDPAEQAARYEEEGIDELVLLDVSASREGRGHDLRTVARVASVIGIPLTAGGGVCSPDDAGRLLEAGADKVSVNTAAVARPALLTEMADRFGSQCCVAAVDASRSGAGWTCRVESGLRQGAPDALAWIRRAEELGAGEILLTSIDRDGTGEGFDIELLSAAGRGLGIPLIASGGASRREHFLEAFRDGGADGALAAGVFHRGEIGVRDLKRWLAAEGVEVRPC